MSDEAPSAALVIIGNEILSGKIVDQNSPFLIRELRQLGITLGRIVVLPDELEAIASEVAYAARTFDWVFTSGGLGPTHDDLTMEAVARAFDTVLEQSDELLLRLMQIGDEPRIEALLPLTYVPRGAELFYGETDEFWPTVHVGNVYIFPGVPQFLRGKFATLRPMLRSEPFAVTAVYCLPRESDLVGHINAAVEAYPGVEIGSYPQFGPVDHRTRVTFESRDERLAQEATDYFLSLIGEDDVVRVER